MLRRALSMFSEKLGFGLISTMYVDGDLYSPTVRLAAVGNVPKDFAASHADLVATRSDPVIRRLASGPALPFTYDQDFYVRAGAAHLWEEMAPHGYRFGVATSLAAGPGKSIWIGVDRPEPLPTDDEVMSRVMADLQLLAVHAHAAAVQLLDQPVPGLAALGLPSLTERELQVLRWAAQGKSARDTAQILEPPLSKRQVDRYAQTAAAKLNVATKSQAIAVAVALGLIAS